VKVPYLLLLLVKEMDDEEGAVVVPTFQEEDGIPAIFPHKITGNLGPGVPGCDTLGVIED
jgi:hypothetical protein